MDAFEIYDKRFASYAIPIVFLEKLHTGLRWAEGPVYFADQRCLLFSDLPNNRMLRFDEETGQVTTFRSYSNFSNGNTRDREGRLVTCEHRGRRVTRTEYDGTVTVLADRYEGKRLNSPNDIVVKCDGTVWFTDPTYGISAEYEGSKAESEIGSCNVYRFDPRDGSLRVVADDFKRPNGLAFSRVDPLHCRFRFLAEPGMAASHPRLSCAGRQASRQPRSCGGLARDPGRFPCRRRWQHLVERRRWRALHHTERRPHRQDPGARKGRERLLRRARAGPPVHLRTHVALRHPPQHARRPAAVNAASALRIGP